MQTIKEVSLEVIDIDLLMVDYDYQKKPYPNRIDKYVKEFDHRFLGELIVNMRDDGTYWIIDGQHRCEVLKRKGYKTAMCIVHYGMSKMEEAEKYNGIAIRNHQQPNEKFKADLLMGKKYAVEINNVVEKNGLNICFDRSGRGIKCVATLVEIYKKYGLSTLDTALELINSCFPGRKDAFMSHIITGFSIFVSTYGKTMEKRRVVNKIHKSGLETFNTKVNMYSAHGFDKAVKEAVTHYYNYQARKKIG